MLGLRYALARGGATSFISLSALLGMAIGVMVLITVLSVMNGFERELRGRILGAVAHAVAQVPAGVPSGAFDEALRAAPGVAGSAPLLQMQGLLSAAGRTRAVLVSGIDPQREPEVSILPGFIRSGSLADLTPGRYGILLGEIVAARLGVEPGDSLVLLTPRMRQSVAGALPRVRRFTVVGEFAYGAELDANYAYIHLADALALSGAAAVPGIRLRLDDVLEAHRTADRLEQDMQARFGAPVYVRDWGATYGSLFRAVGLEKLMVGLLLFSIVLVAVFNVFAALAMTVVEKRGHIAMLRTAGVSRVQIIGVFVTQGLALGLFGLALGAFLGVLLGSHIDAVMALLQRWLGVRFLEVYFIDYFPTDLRWGDVGAVCGVAALLSLLATLYPSWRAAGQDPAEVLSYE